MDNWDDLKVFLAVAHGGSLSAAAKTLGIDAATVGRRVQRLESTSATQLFLKSPQGYVLSTAGQTLLAHVETAAQAIDTGTRTLQGQAQGLAGQIRIGAPDGCANFLLPQVVAEISDTYPELDIQIVALPRVFNLTRREADMAIGVSVPTAGRLRVQKIADYQLHFATADDGNTPQNLSDLTRFKVIGYVPDMIFDTELDYLSEAGVGRVALASNSVSVQLNLLRANAGIGIMHDFALPFARGLKRILVDQFSLKRSFYLIRSEEDRNNQRLNTFAALLVRLMRREIASLESQAQNTDTA